MAIYKVKGRRKGRCAIDREYTIRPRSETSFWSVFITMGRKSYSSLKRQRQLPKGLREGYDTYKRQGAALRDLKEQGREADIVLGLLTVILVVIMVGALLSLGLK